MQCVLRLRKLIEAADHLSAHAIFLHRDDETVLDLAKSVDLRQKAGHHLGALDGLPVVVKGNFDIQGFETTAGSDAFKAAPATRTALVLRALLDKGAVPVWHANMSEFAFSGLGLNLHFDTPINALDPTLVPGGSSSGCASAVALGLAEMAIGTDTSGSARVPAAYQGIVGFRPSMGRYDGTGVTPLAPTLDTPGLLARDMKHLLLLDGALDTGRPDALEFHSEKLVLPSPQDIGTLAPEIAGMLQDAVAALRQNGLEVEQRNLPVLQKIQTLFETHGTLVGFEALRSIGNLVGTTQDKLDPNIRRRLAQAAAFTPDDEAALRTAMPILKADMIAELQGCALILPTVPAPPPNLQAVEADADLFAAENARALSLTMIGAFLDMPSLALPVGQACAGHSLTIAGPCGTDRAVLDLGTRIETLLSDIKGKASV